MSKRNSRLIVKAEESVEKIGASNSTSISKLRKYAYSTQESTDVNLEISKETKAGTKRKREPSTSPRKQKLIKMELEEAHPAPQNWETVYHAIEEMRKRKTAPVDTMGCHTPMLEESEPTAQRYVTLVSLMLSSQTKDEVTFAAVQNLRKAMGGQLTLSNMIAASDETIEQAVCKVGFWRRKSVYLKQAAIKLRDNFEGDLPKTVDELCTLPGVGPKMAFLALQVAWNLNLGIGVDVHVHRITNRLGWHKPPTKTPEQTRLNLQSWLPAKYHAEINPLLVGFGQTICLPLRPKCEECTLSASTSAGPRLCPSAFSGANKVSRKAKIKEEISSSDFEDLEPRAKAKVEIKLED